MCTSHPPPSRRVPVAAHMPSMCAGSGESCGCRCEHACYRNAFSMYSNVGCCRRPREPPLHHVCIVPLACMRHRPPAALDSWRRFAAWQSVLADALQCQPRPLPLQSHHARKPKAHTDLAFSKWRHSLRHVRAVPIACLHAPPSFRCRSQLLVARHHVCSPNRRPCSVCRKAAAAPAGKRSVRKAGPSLQ